MKLSKDEAQRQFKPVIRTWKQIFLSPFLQKSAWPADDVDLGVALLAGGRLEDVQVSEAAVEEDHRTNRLRLKHGEHFQDEVAAWERKKNEELNVKKLIFCWTNSFRNCRKNLVGYEFVLNPHSVEFCFDLDYVITLWGILCSAPSIRHSGDLTHLYAMKNILSATIIKGE